MPHHLPQTSEVMSLLSLFLLKAITEWLTTQVRTCSDLPFHHLTVVKKYYPVKHAYTCVHVRMCRVGGDELGVREINIVPKNAH